MAYSLSITTTPYRYERSMPCKKILKNLSRLAQNLLCDICAKLIDFISKKISSPEFIARNRQTEKAFICLRFPIYHLYEPVCLEPKRSEVHYPSASREEADPKYCPTPTVESYSHPACKRKFPNPLVHESIIEIKDYEGSLRQVISA
jgi:hypothetical protein